MGAALASGRRTLSICGDASVEEDYIYPSFGYAVTRKLPILFVCEDNGLSILTPVATRRCWSAVDFARSLGMPAIDITDDPWLVAHYVQELSKNLPAFMNIHTVRNLWHAGTGCDGPPEWDRYHLIREELNRLGLEDGMRRSREKYTTGQYAMGTATAETIEITRNHLTKNNGLLMGQCVTAVGWIGGTVRTATASSTSR